jgi:hypothetical protein
MKLNQDQIIDKLESNGIFHLKELIPRLNSNRTESIYIEFEEEFKKDIFEKLLKVSGTVTSLSKETNIKFTKLFGQLTRNPFSLSTLKELSNILVKSGYLSYSLDFLEQKIYYIKSGGSKSERIFYPRFPINFLTKEGMRFISHIYHDGSIGKDNKQPNYRNYSKEECLEFLEDSQKLFGKINRKLNLNPDGTYSVHLPTIVGEIMIAIGYISGDRTKQNPPTFTFLEDINDNDLLSEFIAKAFNDDGYIGKRSAGLQQSSLIKDGLRMPSNVLMLDKLFLEKLGIKVNGPTLKDVYKNRHGNCTNYKIDIYSKENLRIFNKNITLIDYKRNKLEKFLNNGYKLKS